MGFPRRRFVAFGRKAVSARRLPWLSSIWPPPSHGGNETRLLVVNLYSFFLIHGSVRIVFFSISSRRALSCLLCLYLMTIVALNNWRGDLVSNRYMQC
jgi:hypothetical protein